MHATRIVFIVLLMSAIVAIRAGAESVPVSEVPAEARKAADEAVPLANWSSATKTGSSYTLRGTAAGRSVDVLYDGSAAYVFEYLSYDEIPEAARRALKEFQTDFTPNTSPGGSCHGLCKRYVEFRKTFCFSVNGVLSG